MYSGLLPAGCELSTRAVDIAGICLILVSVMKRESLCIVQI